MHVIKIFEIMTLAVDLGDRACGVEDVRRNCPVVDGLSWGRLDVIYVVVIC